MKKQLPAFRRSGNRELLIFDLGEFRRISLPEALQPGRHLRKHRSRDMRLRRFHTLHHQQ